jgi:hypothetical protein
MALVAAFQGRRRSRLRLRHTVKLMFGVSLSLPGVTCCRFVCCLLLLLVPQRWPSDPWCERGPGPGAGE